MYACAHKPVLVLIVYWDIVGLYVNVYHFVHVEYSLFVYTIRSHVCSCSEGQRSLDIRPNDSPPSTHKHIQFIQNKRNKKNGPKNDWGNGNIAITGS